MTRISNREAATMPVARTLFTTLLAVAAAVGWSPVPGEGERAPEPVVRGQFLGAVTLITGDHVTVRQVGEQVVPQVTPAPGREHVHFSTTSVGDSLLVVPQDAWTPVSTGQLDQRLFDVTTLLRDGYGDERRPDLPLIVQGGPADVRGSGASVTRELSAVDAVAVRQPKQDAANFWATRRSAGRIWLDGTRRLSLDVSVPQIGAPDAWDADYTGEGVRVAVLDTGIDQSHPDLRDRVVAAKNFTDDRNVRDNHGHGTHVASIIAGTGQASDGENTGVAPGADLLIAKVCSGAGCPESAILAGMEWAVKHGARVINLSLGGPNSAAEDPLELAVDRLTVKHGTLFVTAAGNDGAFGAETVSSPGSANAALTVGAVDDQDAVAQFSGRGPRVHDAALKPEIVAPGVEIMAARSRFSSRGKPRDRYMSMSGTSMATPHVAGAAAILAQRHPDWTAARLKAGLIASAKPLEGVGVFAQGAGRVDVARSVDQSVYAEPDAVSIGRMSWPHEDDRSVTETVTYHNADDRPQTLRLSLPVRGPADEPVPDGMFQLSETTLTVPARGKADVEVTVNTALPAADGTFGAHIVATGDDGVRVSTPVAVDREAESYDLTLRVLDAAGEETDNHFAFVFGVDQVRFRPVPGIDGSGTLRVRAGRYHVDAAINTPRPGGTLSDTAKIVHPTVDVRADTTVVLDARAARPVSVTFDRPDVVAEAVGVGYTRNVPDNQLNTGVLGDTFDRIGVGQIGESAPEGDLVTSIGGVWAVPDAQGELMESPVTYNLAWFEHGSVPTGFTRKIVDADLAEVRVTYRTQAKRKLGTKMWIAREPRSGAANGFGFGFRLPLERTEFHNVDGLQWSGELEQWSRVRKQVRTETVLIGGPVDHQPGQSAVEEWNSAVFGPGYTSEGEFAVRSADVLSFGVPLFTDASLDRTGVSLMDSGSTVLYQDDVKLGETGQPGIGSFDVPAESATYRLEVRATRGALGVSQLSTKVSSVWTFTSARPPDPDPKGKGKGGVALPLLAVRFAPPDLGPRNVIGTRTIQIPVTVQRPAESPKATLTTLTVEASLNDGRTWRPLTVTRDRPDGGIATITHPPGGGAVSLRATATDSDGNTVTQTIIRAYRSR
jgi:subtilisin family serine protease